MSRDPSEDWRTEELCMKEEGVSSLLYKSTLKEVGCESQLRGCKCWVCGAPLTAGHIWLLCQIHRKLRLSKIVSCSLHITLNCGWNGLTLMMIKQMIISISPTIWLNLLFIILHTIVSNVSQHQASLTCAHVECRDAHLQCSVCDGDLDWQHMIPSSWPH